MAFSLHAATIPSYLQILGTMNHLLDKAEAWCQEKGLPHSDLLGARIAPDMHPFTYQVKTTAVHSWGAIEGLRRGVFAPDLAPPPDSIAGLRQRIADAQAGLTAVTPAELEGYLGRDMRFEYGEYKLEFTAEEFLLSFSQPNFYFHATTAYDILRMKGLPIGKRDFTGRVRLKR